MADPTLSRIAVYPVKSLDPHELATATVREAGGLSYDREFAIHDGDGEHVNGKRERAVHRLRSSFDPAGPSLVLREHGTERTGRFDLRGDRGGLAAWLTDYLGYEVSVRRDDTGGFPDDTHAAGPTVVSTGTLAAVADWFEVDREEAFRRLRPNLVVDAPRFWEDRLYASTDRERVVGFEVGDVAFEGVNPCQRCAVPGRDPDTGEETEGFRERFVERRRETLPSWAGTAWFDHHFRLMVNTRVPQASVGGTLSVGDPVTVGAESRR
jgi:uncharacterized protein YcbX